MKSEGKLIWITGLAGSGKTTLAEKIYKEIKKKDLNSVHLDGDHLREILNEQHTYDLESRKRTAGIYSKLCHNLTNQGIHVVMSTISLFYEVQEYNRKNNQFYYEILVRANEEELLKRNKKGLYTSHVLDVMGIHQHPEFPKNPTLILENNNLNELEENIKKIMNLFNLEGE